VRHAASRWRWAAPSPIVLGFVGVPNADAHTMTHSVLLGAFLAEQATFGKLHVWVYDDGLAARLPEGS
jgi:hypothetical protein